MNLRYQLALKKVVQTLSLQPVVESLDRLAGPGEEYDTPLIDLIPDPNVIQPDEAADLALLRAQIRFMLSRLTPRERRIIELRFGLLNGETQTLEAIGRQFDITRERVRQLETRAMRKLRQLLLKHYRQDFPR